jgi:hypothetical protein
VLTVSEAGEERAARDAVFKGIPCAVDFAALSRAVEYSPSLAQEPDGRQTLVNAVEWFPDEATWIGEAGTFPTIGPQMEEPSERTISSPWAGAVGIRWISCYLAGGPGTPARNVRCGPSGKETSR